MKANRLAQGVDSDGTFNKDISVSDVNVRVPPVSVEATSIITQVDRNGKSNQPSVPRVSDEETEYQPTLVKRRSFFKRLLCCVQSKSHKHEGQISLVAKPERSIPRHLPLKMPDIAPPPGGTRGKKCLALDLDETLVHSSFQPVDNSSFTITVAIEGIMHNVYVIKRPGVDEFLELLAQHYEIMIYTASLSKYADPLLDILDPGKKISSRLFRENCVFHDGHYVKDLSLLNREISQTIIVDNSAMSYIFHTENAIDCTSFFDDPRDVELWQIADFLVSISKAEDVRHYCKHWREWCRNNPSTIPANAR